MSVYDRGHDAQIHDIAKIAEGRIMGAEFVKLLSEQVCPFLREPIDLASLLSVAGFVFAADGDGVVRGRALDVVHIKGDARRIAERQEARCRGQHGDRIAQMVINQISQARFEVVETLEETDRNSGGFGHTGI